MKKFSLFILSSLFGLILFAADRQPMVTVNTSNDYEVMIDGTYYRGNNSIPNLNQGTHSVQVYQTKRGLLGKRRTLVSTSNFELNNNDVSIFVDANGQLRINESGNRNRSERRNRTGNDNERRNSTGDDNERRNRTGDDNERRNRTGDDNDWRNRGSNRNHDNHDNHDEEDNDDYNDKKMKKDKKEKHNNGHYNGRGKKMGSQKHNDD